MNRRILALVTLAGAGATLLAACSGGSSAGSSAGSFRADAAGGAVADASSAPSAAGGMAAGRAAAAPQTVHITSSSLIITGTISLTVARNGDVGTAATRATGIADGAGGRVDADSRSSSAGKSDPASATLVLRVPNAALPAVTKQLGALGTVRSQDMQTKDVTTQVADVNSRVTSARAAIAGLTRLYARASSVRDLITVESALTARQADLEALEAEQRTLSAQTSLATLTVSITVRTPAVAKHHSHRSGFTGGLHNGWGAFTATLRAVATAVGAALPFAIVVLIVGAAGVMALRRRQTQPAPDPEA